MQIPQTTKEKIDAILDKVCALKAGDFAQQGSRDALAEIEEIFKKHRETVVMLESTGTQSVVTNHCNVVLSELFRYLPILGFLHRSKSASNAFEIYGPLLRLAQSVIGPDTKLILSSEWDFSPFTFVQMQGLPDFVLIGLPASEAGNALLIPLAGHEFGHSIWPLDRASERYTRKLIEFIIARIRANWKEYQTHFHYIQDEKTLDNDMFAVQTWAPALRWAQLQCEEVFCDLVGLWLFGESYLYAFAYLLAPGMAASGGPKYPSVAQRVSNLERAAAEYSVHVPSAYAVLFEKTAPRGKSANDFLHSLADEASNAHVGQLITHVRDYMAKQSIKPADAAGVDDVFASFELMVPAHAPASLAAIVNAGWRASHTENIWSTYPQVAGRHRIVLNELVLKSAQVLEFQELTRNDSSGE